MKRVTYFLKKILIVAVPLAASGQRAIAIDLACPSINIVNVAKDLGHSGSQQTKVGGYKFYYDHQLNQAVDLRNFYSPKEVAKPLMRFPASLEAATQYTVSTAKVGPKSQQTACVYEGKPSDASYRLTLTTAWENAGY